MKNSYTTFCLITGGVFALLGCSQTKEQLGLTKAPPDEFAVVRRAPLDMPPDYYLRPPQPGAARPQEQAAAQEARQTLLGQGAGVGDISAGENLLLEKAGAQNPQPGIRARVDQETREGAEDNRPVTQKLLGIGGDEPSATIVDPAAEAERLIKNQAEGKPATSGETPTIED